MTDNERGPIEPIVSEFELRNLIKAVRAAVPVERLGIGDMTLRSIISTALEAHYKGRKP